MVTNLYYYFIDYFNIINSRLFENAKDTKYMSTNIKHFLEKVSKKRDANKIPLHLQCIELNRFKDPCGSYRVDGTKYCHAHTRESSTGENHIFSKTKEKQLPTDSQAFLDFIDELTTF